MENKQVCNVCNDEGKLLHVMSEDEKNICDDCKKELDDFTGGYFECETCGDYYCYNCRTEIMDHNDSRYYKYCSEDCTPSDLLYHIEEMEEKYSKMEEEYTRINSTKGTRQEELIEKLHGAGLELRADSKLCKKYIEQDLGDVDEIVERMCQMKFLYEYNDMKAMLDQVGEEYEETLDAGYFPDFEVFPEAELQILEKIKQYPEVYPWQTDRYARVIQAACENWLWKPVCRDGKLGIHAKLMMDRVQDLQ